MSNNGFARAYLWSDGLYRTTPELIETSKQWRRNRLNELELELSKCRDEVATRRGALLVKAELETTIERLRVALISCGLRAKARKLKHPNIPWERRFASIERIVTAALAEKKE